METVSRFFNMPDRSFFLFGPRGTGKSTWLCSLLPDALRIDLLDPATFRSLQARPEGLVERVRGRPDVTWVVVDEVQRVPALLPAVHLLIEEDPRRRFALTGSSARKLRRTGTDLLAGRAIRMEMHPFMAAELGNQFVLDEAITYGLVPLVVDSPAPRQVLDSYVALYLREEVQAEGLVRNLGNFSRFLEVMSFSQGALLNLANVASECGVGRKTAEGYLEVLEDLLLGFRLPVFTRRAGRATVTHAKFYFFDTGVFRSLRPSGPLDRREETEGAALEGLVAQHLRAWAALSGNRAGLSYWRTRSGNEVDFVVYGERDFVAIEVKNSRTVRPADLRGLRAFRDDYPEAEAILLYRGAERLRMGDVICVPVEDFMRKLVPFRGLLA